MKLLGYIVRSKTNPALILCTNGEWHIESLCGPAQPYGAKLYKTKAGAQRVRGGEVIVQEEWA